MIYFISSLNCAPGTTKLSESMWPQVRVDASPFGRYNNRTYIKDWLPSNIEDIYDNIVVEPYIILQVELEPSR